jgi:hypothetical protein
LAIDTSSRHASCHGAMTSWPDFALRS